MRSWLAGLCLAFFIPARLMAWNAEGHMVVAQIAYNHLDSVVKTKCDALIAVPLANSSTQSSNFVTSACWADDFKNQLGTGIWHYIDQPFSLDGTATNGVGTAAFDVVRAINLCIATLQNTNSPATNRATYLRYLIHFVGDIQQPLHCSTAVSATHTGGDAGGNSFTVTGWGNLHSLWDSGGGFLSDSLSRPLNSGSQTTLNNRVSIVETAHPFTGNPGTIPDPQTWAAEGLVLAETVNYVGITNNTTPTAAYLNSASATTSARMAFGGKRLADLLNTIFAPISLPLTAVPAVNKKFAFIWASASGTSYRVQWKLNLTDSAWNDLADVTATSASASFTNAITQAQRFYRVVGL